MHTGYRHVVVSDSGAGMAAEESTRVFDRFYKGGASSGSGLGLPIAKALVTAHGGQIFITSEPDVGTSVRFTLPAAR